MKDFRIELNEFRKMGKTEKVIYLFAGILMILFGIVIASRKLSLQAHWSGFFLPLALIIPGINIILYCQEVFFRLARRYVSISESGFDYSLSFFSPSRRFKWPDIRRIEIRLLRILVTLKSGKVFKIRLGEIHYHDIRLMKQLILETARKKRIPCIDLTEKDLHAGESPLEVK